ncbi:MFS transporter [Paraburkholderia sp. BCC1886]|uniref:MFS transporter n=1 Tax=Paraburkholderia sp. BCC1886 TaxID=2562670 RepID=UPI001183D6F6|nr:MFS transporter [Paraburkholderia sp. BCC1886]
MQLSSATPVADPLAATAHDSLYRKITWRIIPFLFMGYVIAFLDRINIGFAQLQMKHDLGFSDAMYGLGAGIFYVGYVFFEVPSNMLLARFGARFTFTRIMVMWGLTSACMMFVSRPGEFYTLRFLLGVFEAGFLPGITVYISYWYPPRRRAGIMSIFFAGTLISGVIGGLFSGWIMRDMAGVAGLFGWQWLFVIEAAPAILLGVFAAFWLDDGPQRAKWLSDDEKRSVLTQLEVEENPMLARAKNALLDALRTPRVYLFAFVYFSVACGGLLINFWMPLIIRDFGIQGIVSISLYTAIPNAIGAIGLLIIARRSDRRGERRWHFAACTLGGGIALFLLTLHIPSFPIMLIILSAAAVLIFAAVPIFWAVPFEHLSKRAVAPGIALIGSLGITSGIVTPWAVGQIKTLTGSIDNALYILSALLVVSALAFLAGVPRRAARRHVIGTETLP